MTTNVTHSALLPTSVFPKRDYCYYYHYYYHHYYYHHRHYQKVTTIRNALKLKSMEEH
jgi:hypothetical protein